MKLFSAILFAGVLTVSSFAKEVIERKTVSHDRDGVFWYSWVKPADKACFRNCGGWIEFDFEIKNGGWYQLWRNGVVCGWNRNLYLDGKIHRFNYITDQIKNTKGRPERWQKEMNLFLTPGKHSMRFERTQFPGGHFGTEWKLEESGNDPRGCIDAQIENNVVRACDKLKITLTGGTKVPTEYEFVIQELQTKAITEIGKVSFPATDKPVVKTVEFSIPKQGMYDVLFKVPGGVSFRSDLSAGQIAVVDTSAPDTGTELKKTLVVDIDCVKTAPLAEFGGATHIVKKQFGSYRESTGSCPHRYWGLDSFSFKAKLPDADHAYQLVVDYPDDAFRSVGFWTNDGIKDNTKGIILTGGIETGAQYRITNTMLTHEAFFYPRGTELVIAAVNLNQGSKAAASRIRIYRIDGKLPASKIEARRGRVAGVWFEEPGRWKRHFGMKDGEIMVQNMAAMERWAEWNRFSGVNLMHPSVVAYNNVLYPSKIMTGSNVANINEVRILALLAEKYNNELLPHFSLHCSAGLQEKVGLKFEKVKDKKGNVKDKVIFAAPDAKDMVSWGADGTMHGAWNPVAYNALNPKVQDLIVSCIGEMADTLADCKSFKGITIRVATPWQYSSWFSIMGGKKGYGDWTVAQFEKETGIKVPGKANDPKRFEKRYTYLMGEKKAEWMAWRQEKMLNYYRKIRDRIRKARPDATLFIAWWYSGNVSANKISKRQELEESGVNLEALAKEPGITLLSDGYNYGRRNFTPYGNSNQAKQPFMERTGDNTGLRGISVGSCYYEVNEGFDWTKLGGKKYCAFDTCAPAGINELAIYAYALANSDAGCLSFGGNGWIFGTPALIRPFMREYFALPAEMFSPVKTQNDPVMFRELKNKDGYWFYAVNLLDVPVKVKIELKNAKKVVSAVDGTPCKTEFTLAPYMLKTFRADPSAAIIGTKVSYDPAVKARIEPLMKFARELKQKILKRQAGLELPAKDLNEAVRVLDRIEDHWKKGEIWHAGGLMNHTALTYIHEFTGNWPMGLFDGFDCIGWPGNQKAMPKLKLEKIIGGNLMEISGKRISFTESADRIYAFVENSAEQARMLEFDKSGKYLRTAHLLKFTDADRAHGDSRFLFMKNPFYQTWGKIACQNGKLWLQEKQGVTPYDPVTMLQLPEELGKKMDFTTSTTNPVVKFSKPKDNIAGATQFVEHDGKLMFAAGTKLFELDPKTDSIRMVQKFKLKNILSIAFDANGNLYIGVKNIGKIGGICVLRAKKQADGTFGIPEAVSGKPLEQQWYLQARSLLVREDGAILFQGGPWTSAEVHAWKDGQVSTVFSVGGRDFRTGSLISMFRGKDGRYYIAGGGARKVMCFSPDGKLIWERVFRKEQSGDSLPFRYPLGICEDGQGRLWVADHAGNRLVCLDHSGKFLGTFGYYGTMDDRSGEGFCSPWHVAFANGYLYVYDAGNERILKYKVE